MGGGLHGINQSKSTYAIRHIAKQSPSLVSFLLKGFCRQIYLTSYELQALLFPSRRVHSHQAHAVVMTHGETNYSPKTLNWSAGSQLNLEKRDPLSIPRANEPSGQGSWKQDTQDCPESCSAQRSRSRFVWKQRARNPHGRNIQTTNTGPLRHQPLANFPKNLPKSCRIAVGFQGFTF